MVTGDGAGITGRSAMKSSTCADSKLMTGGGGGRGATLAGVTSSGTGSVGAL